MKRKKVRRQVTKRRKTSKDSRSGTASQRHRATPKGKAREYLRNAKKRMLYQIAVYGKTTDPQHMYNNPYRAAQAVGFRSGLEVVLDQQLTDANVPHEYETVTLEYEQPAETRRYTPDFILRNGIVIEGKGQWVTADRKKMKLVRAQHPDIDIRMVFSRSATRISKKSQTTYAAFCKSLGIKYADKLIPVAWLKEPVNQKSIDAIERARRAR